MILKGLFTILISCSAAYATGFDDSFIWHRFVSRPTGNGQHFIYENNEFRTVYLHSNIYGLDALNWNYLSFDIDRKFGGVGFDFSSVGYEKFYRRNRYTMYVKYNPGKNIKIAPSLEIRVERFGNIGRYAELKGGIFSGYMSKKYNVGLGFAEIELKKPYNHKAPGERFKPVLFGSWIFNDGLTFTVGIRRYENRRTRWIFDQYIAVNENLGLNFGYKNKPSNIYGGIELTINEISVIINYHSVGDLSDTIVWGISFRK